GGHSFQIASDPRLSAVIPLVGWTDLEQSLFPNGAINYKLGIAEFYSGLEQRVGSPPFFNYSQLQFDLFDAAAEGRLPPRYVLKQLRARSIARRDSEGREILDESRQPRVPVFIIQSWDDYLFPAPQVLDVFSQITSPKQIYLGRSGHPPGGHTFEGEEVFIGAQVLRWFDHYLRDIGGTDGRNVSSAPAPFEVPGIRTDRQLVPADASSFELFVKPGGSLLPKKKGADSRETAGGIFRPGRIRSSRTGAEIPSQSDMMSAYTQLMTGIPSRLAYTSRPLTTDTEMIGPSELTLYVGSETSADIDLIVRTFDIAPDGTETEVTVGITRVTGLSAGEIRQVMFRDYGDDWVFKSGHSLQIRIANIDFPDFRPPGINDNTPSTMTIHSGRTSPSSIRLSVRSR
ncbi:MAG TPA: CocE/NonD family hydrolase, partial [Blastocatellia bacterium]|nr:CocE/NonD family hydrolase [Blastocatellia bacterium]